MDYYKAVLKKYAVFTGRASRAEYWYFVLFNMIFGIVVSILDRVIGTSKMIGPYGLLQSIYLLILIVPSIAVAVRRLHDVGKSGWILLISLILVVWSLLIPLIGVSLGISFILLISISLASLAYGIWLFVLMVTDSNPVDNKYGPNPKMSSTPIQPSSPQSIPPQVAN